MPGIGELARIRIWKLCHSFFAAATRIARSTAAGSSRNTRCVSAIVPDLPVGMCNGGQAEHQKQRHQDDPSLDHVVDNFFFFFFFFFFLKKSHMVSGSPGKIEFLYV